MTLLIRGATVLTPDEQIGGGAVIVEGERIAWIGPAGSVDDPSWSPTRAGARSAPSEEIDARGLILAPGFIDLQINGAFGDDFTADPSSIWRVAARLPRYGVTSFLPTIITSPLEKIALARQALEIGRPPDFQGARPLGLHLEGPFLNPAKKGAHNPHYLRPPEPRLVADWSPSTGVRLVTLAPELPGAAELIRVLTARGVVVSAGHSLATFDQAQAGFAAGTRYGTHLFNAMPPLAHREPGLPGALLATPDQVIGIIADGIHVHPAIVKIAWMAKHHALNLVTDAMAALGMAPGSYKLNEFEVIVTETDTRLANGTLAGSVLSLDQALRNLIAFTGCSLVEALAAVTAVPADLLGLGQERGRIRAGLIADLVLLTPDLSPVMTIAAGRTVWRCTS